MPHTKTSGHPAGNNKCNDFSVAQQLIPAKIKKATSDPKILSHVVINVICYVNDS